MIKITKVRQLTQLIADELKCYDEKRPVYRHYDPGIGPIAEPTLVKQIANQLAAKNIPAQTKRSPDMVIGDQWGIEFKIVRPFGNNTKQAEHWSENLLHPYPGNVSLLGDALKLRDKTTFPHKCVFAICYEHGDPQIPLGRLLDTFELIADRVMQLRLGKRVEEKRTDLVHKCHQTLRCVSWRVYK